MSFQIKFHQIRAFVEVARQGSIRGASRTLNLSQPALTKSIKELEEGMAAQLFVRRSKGVALTECGEGFYHRANLILEELRAAQDDIRQRQGELAGQINIGMGASISRSLMPAVITRFHAQHPQVNVRIMEGQLVSMINELRQGELDFTINTYYQGPYDHEFTFEKLFEKPFAVFCRAGHPATGATSINELLQYNWTMPTPREVIISSCRILLTIALKYRELALSVRPFPPVLASSHKAISSAFYRRSWAAIRFWRTV